MNRAAITGIILAIIIIIAAAFLLMRKPSVTDFAKIECKDQPAGCLQQEQQVDDLLRQCAGTPDERACMEQKLGRPLEDPQAKITIT